MTMQHHILPNLYCAEPVLRVQIPGVSLSVAQNQHCRARDSIAAIANFMREIKRSLSGRKAIICVLFLLPAASGFLFSVVFGIAPYAAS